MNFDELFLELADDLVAAEHRAGADLHRRRAEQEELRRVEAGLDAADAADLRRRGSRARPPSPGAARSGAPPGPSSRRGPSGPRRSASGAASSGRCRDTREDRVDHRDAVGAAAQRGRRPAPSGCRRSASSSPTPGSSRPPSPSRRPPRRCRGSRPSPCPSCARAGRAGTTGSSRSRRRRSPGPRATICCQASLRYSSMIDAIRILFG